MTEKKGDVILGVVIQQTISGSYTGNNVLDYLLLVVQ